jgi:RNA polymerase sigma factor (sigma-70 family)
MQTIAPVLIEQAKAGDHEAFEAAVGPLLPAAYRLAFGMLLDRGHAEDALQEAVLTAWRRVGNVREGCDVRPWFFAIVANKCRATKRARWWSVVRLGTVEGSQTADWPVHAEDLRGALRRLDHRQRLVVVLHYYVDLTLEQVADTLGVPIGTAKSRLHRAMAALRADPALAEAPA